ncbi:MAG TPA: ZIP family metal transporter [Burkholderiales bacterium]|nr:ZIP family metal transporter [Burkholderiales bacterium]
MTLAWILAATLAGGVLSVIAAALIALSARVTWVPVLISYAVGTLLGAVFLDVLPEAFERAESLETMALTILGGILLFFVLEKLVLWRHCHVEQCEAHDPPLAPHHDQGRSGTMIMIGDTFHNFVDGVLIAAAFLADRELGIVTAVAIIAHEIPQEVGDFLILLHSGFSKRRALLLNMLSSAAMVAGGALGFFTLQGVEQWIPPLLGFAAASMLYVSVADLIPGLHKRPELQATAQQVALIALGIATIWLVGELAHDHT